MKISPARAAAFDILLRIENEKAFSSVLLPVFEEGLAAADRSLCHALVLGTLRRRMYLDKVVDTLAGVRKIDIEVRLALRLAIFQLYFLDKIPSYSAINESVNLVQRARKTSAKGFANAILRRAASEVITPSFADEIEQISIETSHPRWLIERWRDAFGLDEAGAIATANNVIPGVAFRVIGNPDQTDLDVIDSFPRSAEIDGCYVAASGDHRVQELAARGLIYVQDEASQMTALAVQIPASGTFLDVCAAPGGKTGLIGLRNRDASVFAAGDLYRPRVEFLRDNCIAQGLDSVCVLQFDAERGLPFADASFDVVLVDAPCSGTGTIRRNPEIRYFLKEADVAELALKQLTILENASKLVRPGGSLLYSTCSLEIDENEEVCRRFLTANTGFLGVAPGVPERFVGPGLFARTWPQRDKMDGFFIARFQKS